MFPGFFLSHFWRSSLNAGSLETSNIHRVRIVTSGQTLYCRLHCTLSSPGYYPFEESPARIPPIVRKPPYLQTQVRCPGVDGPGLGSTQEQTLDNLCGDLNKGEQFIVFFVVWFMFKTLQDTCQLILLVRTCSEFPTRSSSSKIKPWISSAKLFPF